MQTKASPCGTGAGNRPLNNLARISAVVLAVPALLFQGACSTSRQAAPQAAGAGATRYIVTAATTPFYRNGPAQPSGPDLRLKKDQVVTMVERRYGYSRVLDPDGEAGYIPTDDIAPAPDQSPPPAATPKKTGRASAPDFDQPNDAKLPVKQPPSDEPVPSFRY